MWGFFKFILCWGIGMLVLRYLLFDFLYKVQIDYLADWVVIPSLIFTAIWAVVYGVIYSQNTQRDLAKLGWKKMW